MYYGASGGVIVQCTRCGKVMEIENFFAACPMKYCRECAARAKSDQIAGYMREKRRKARERRDLERQQNQLLTDENELLRQQVRELQYRVEALDAVCRKAVQNGKE